MEKAVCPLCEKEARPQIDWDNSGYSLQYRIACYGCGLASGPYKTRVEAQIAWNTRPLSAREQALLNACAPIVDVQVEPSFPDNESIYGVVCGGGSYITYGDIRRIQTAYASYKKETDSAKS